MNDDNSNIPLMPGAYKIEVSIAVLLYRGLPKHAARCGVSVITKQEKVQTSASLMFSVLNPRIWTMVAGGGASAIYADTNKCRPYRLFRSCRSRTQSINDPETILDVYLVGSFDDSPSKKGHRRKTKMEKGYSYPLCQKIITALQNIPEKFHLRLLFVLRTLCLVCFGA